MEQPRTLVTFRSSSFNTTDERDDFINPGNFGDDVARSVMDGLRRQGVAVEDEMEQEDHGWYFTYQVNGKSYDFVVGWADGEWIGWVERSVGLLGSLLGGRRRGIDVDAVKAIHAVLSGMAGIQDVQWHDASRFQAGETASGAAEPTM